MVFPNSSKHACRKGTSLFVRSQSVNSLCVGAGRKETWRSHAARIVNLVFLLFLTRLSSGKCAVGVSTLITRTTIEYVQNEEEEKQEGSTKICSSPSKGVCRLTPSRRADIRNVSPTKMTACCVRYFGEILAVFVPAWRVGGPTCSFH